ncbi:helix-turn-helix transcriptional regulator [Streptomyces misionensis]|uniref:helix-turn-helix transcriptional regulator n=1 Tax=Streptomyces misionensis TaxID=67331 RepID=UPI0033D7DED3
MTTALTSPALLTPGERRVAEQLVHGRNIPSIAYRLFLSTHSVASHLRSMRRKLGCPGSSPAVLVHALLTAQAVPPPAPGGDAPDFTPGECTVIRAIAEHTRNGNIGSAIGVRASDVRTEVDAVVNKAGARSQAHLVGLAHAWHILGTSATSDTHDVPTTGRASVMDDAGTACAPALDTHSRRTAYEMLPVLTSTARSEAAALACRHLAEQRISHSFGYLVDLIWSQTMLGLYEDKRLIAFVVVLREPDMRHWGVDGRAPGILVTLVPPVPGQDSHAGRLLTLWLADQAARRGLEWVWWEIPAAADVTAETSATLMGTLRDLGWEVLSPVRRADGGRVVRLRLRAERRDALTAAISAPEATLRMLAVSER